MKKITIPFVERFDFVFVGLTENPNSLFGLCMILENSLAADKLVVIYKKSSINLINTPISFPLFVKGIL